MSFRDLVESDVTDAHERNAELHKRHIKKPEAAVVSAIGEGFVVKDHTGKPVFAHGADTVAKKKAEELTQSTGNKHTVSFDREAHSGSIKENQMSFIDIVEAQLDELSRDGLTTYIQAAKNRGDKDRSKGIALAQLKKWGDKKYGLPEPKVKATEESIKEGNDAIGGYWHAAHQANLEADKHSEHSVEHAKWMCVHHHALANYHEATGKGPSADLHNGLSHIYKTHVGALEGKGSRDEDFHSRNSHHFNDVNAAHDSY